MSYQVLARKWRPRDFGSLVGQEHVVRALQHALEHGRLHHAYLFTGTRGVGKTTLARILAKCLNCEAGLTAQPCGKCSACVEIDAGRFVDLLEVDAATNTKVDEMRQLLETAQYAPTRGRYKVYVIDEVHMLSTSAFNAMLKTLEEPPEHLKFILATTDPQKIPVTVLSRCLQFNLKQMPQAAIAGHLAAILDKESISYERDALSLIGRAAAGSMRDALSLLDQAIAHGAGSVTAQGVSHMLGAIDERYLLQLLERIGSADAQGAVAIAQEMQSRSLSFDTALADLASLLLRLALAQAAPEALDDAQRGAVANLAGALDPETVQLYYQIALQGRQDLPLAPDEYSGFVMTVIRMLAFRPDAGATGAASSRSSQAQAPGTKRVAAAAARPAKPAAAPQASEPEPAPVAQAPGPAPEAGEWPELVRQLTITGAARELARNAELRSRDNGAFDLVVPKAKAYLAERSYQDKLKAALAVHFGSHVSLSVSVGEVAGVTAAALEASARQARRADADTAVRTDGFVSELVNLFDGRIVESTIRETDRESERENQK
jgi:DNA polymerase III subunit gamma/tau